MPRPKKCGAPEPKRRSRNGCWPCKNRKVKCDEGHPQCDNCQKASLECDYSVRLNWLGDGNYRPTKKRRQEDTDTETPTLSRLLSDSSPRHGKDCFKSETGSQDCDLLSVPRTPFETEHHLLASPDTAPATHILAPIPDEACHISVSGPSIPVDLLDATREPSSNDPTAFLRHYDLSRHQSDSRDGRVVGQSIRPCGTELEEVSSDIPGDTRTPLSSEPSWNVARSNSKPAIPEDAVEAPLWSPASASMSKSPGLRTSLQSALSLPSAPSPLSWVSTPGGEDEQHYVPNTTPYLPSPSDIRRLSVKSLLISPYESRPRIRSLSGLGKGCDQMRAATPETATFYGYDNGTPDRDIGENDDSKAIVGYLPTACKGGYNFNPEDLARESHPSDFGFGMRETGNYYENLVEVWISRDLEPLPLKLRQNPMNLLYFHHFLNHTARVLVPHDDPRSNPFRTVLPQMAVKHDNLLSLLLAYSASHRARHLKYPEPSLRIAHLVQGVIADLRSLVQQSMSNPNTVISTADAAASIMLASLEIISPAAIGGSIPWQHHLHIARELISRMPDGLRRIQTTTQEQRVRSFLWSWFAYLDVLGSLSGGPATLLTPTCYTTGGPPSPSPKEAALTNRPRRGDEGEDHWDEDMERIDCILGFTPRCVFLLARIAELARHCEGARLRSPPTPSGGGWTPDAATRAAASALETAALRSLAAPSRPCGHVHGASPLRRWDRTQMAAANRAFHHAALIHLHRRVLGKRSAHSDVRGAAQSVLECLEHVEPGSSAELGLLFPMFTAGCELVDPVERAAILERVVSVERTGMMQVQRARKLMEKVWETGQPWETLVDAEFIG